MAILTMALLILVVQTMAILTRWEELLEEDRVSHYLDARTEPKIKEVTLTLTLTLNPNPDPNPNPSPSPSPSPNPNPSPSPNPSPNPGS